MKYLINNNYYCVIVIKKNIKNTYIKISDNLEIIVTTNYLTTEKYIKKLLEENEKFLTKAILKKEKSLNKEFSYLGKPYDLVYISNLQQIDISNDKLFLKDDNQLNKWLDQQTKILFKERLDKLYKLFNNIPHPNLKIRKMKTRWGVCNRKNNNVTLNYNLIYYDIEKLDYVIIHELCHFVHFDHSKAFWNEVSKYCPDYKKIRRELKD